MKMRGTSPSCNTPDNKGWNPQERIQAMDPSDAKSADNPYSRGYYDHACPLGAVPIR